DEAPIVGFRSVFQSATAHRKVVTDRAKDEVQYFEGTRSTYEVESDYAVSYRQAWAENVICQVNAHTFDVDLSMLTTQDDDDVHGTDDLGDVGELSLLSQLSRSVARQWLGRVVRHQESIRTASDLGVTWLRRVRASGPAYADAAMIVFACNDEDDSRNSHPEAIRRAINAIAPDLDVVIATSGEKEDGAKTLRTFCEDGKGDVLIVKQLAGQGQDSPRIKVVVDLSPMRSRNLWLQRIMRGARPYNGMFTFHLISPSDPIIFGEDEGFFKTFVEEQGGGTVTVDEMDLIATKPIEGGEDREETLLVVYGAHASSIHDSKENMIAIERLSRVVRFCEQFPLLLTTYTIPEIEQRLMKTGMIEHSDEDTPHAESPQWVNTEDVANERRATINTYAKDLGRLRFLRYHRRPYRGGNREDSVAWGVIQSDIWGEAYSQTSVSPGTELRRILDLDTLDQLVSIFQRMVEQEGRR
ncbi:MAG: hypothetical protein M3440_03425, partial [Chloroflexota bacterium]|nr:hypothetical protein [Chloroflexota bacterium]